MKGEVDEDTRRCEGARREVRLKKGALKENAVGTWQSRYTRELQLGKGVTDSGIGGGGRVTRRSVSVDGKDICLV